MTDIVEQHAVATFEAVRGGWNRWGEVDEQVIAHIISPELMGGPAWPTTRQAHAIVRHEDEILVCSDGLSDPKEWTDAPPSNGFEAEVYAMTGDQFDDTSTMAMPATWLGSIVMGTSSVVAQNGAQFARILQAEQTLTLGFGQNALPESAKERFLDADGNMTVMLGITGDEIPDSVDGPLSAIRLVNIKLLTAAEAAFCVREGTGSGQARAELVRRFREQGRPLHSSLERASVVD